MTYVAVIDSYGGVALYDTVLTASVYALQKIWDIVWVGCIIRMLHVFAVRRVFICLLIVVPIRVGHTWSVNKQIGVSLNAAQFLIIFALG